MCEVLIFCAVKMMTGLPTDIRAYKVLFEVVQVFLKDIN